MQIECNVPQRLCYHAFNSILKIFYQLNRNLTDLGNAKINKTAIANNLTTETSGYVLDARQGKAINDRITANRYENADVNILNWLNDRLEQSDLTRVGDCKFLIGRFSGGFLCGYAVRMYTSTIAGQVTYFLNDTSVAAYVFQKRADKDTVLQAI